MVIFGLYTKRQKYIKITQLSTGKIYTVMNVRKDFVSKKLLRFAQAKLISKKGYQIIRIKLLNKYKMMQGDLT